VGFDLVGYEDPGITLHQYLPELLWFRQKVAALGLDIPFILHAGETLSDGGPVDENVGNRWGFHFREVIGSYRFSLAAIRRHSAGY
jgi:hypothetical protein